MFLIYFGLSFFKTRTTLVLTSLDGNSPCSSHKTHVWKILGLHRCQERLKYARLKLFGPEALSECILNKVCLNSSMVNNFIIFWLSFYVTARWTSSIISCIFPLFLVKSSSKYWLATPNTSVWSSNIFPSFLLNLAIWFLFVRALAMTWENFEFVSLSFNKFTFALCFQKSSFRAKREVIRFLTSMFFLHASSSFLFRNALIFRRHSSTTLLNLLLLFKPLLK